MKNPNRTRTTRTSVRLTELRNSVTFTHPTLSTAAAPRTAGSPVEA
jgi:hypothetical protein